MTTLMHKKEFSDFYKCSFTPSIPTNSKIFRVFFGYHLSITLSHSFIYQSALPFAFHALSPCSKCASLTIFLFYTILFPFSPIFPFPTSKMLLRVVLFHAVFATFGELQSQVLNQMSGPVRRFLANSLRRRYGISPESFLLVYSGTASLYFLGIFIAGLVTGWLMERYGRKGTAVYIRSSIGAIGALFMLAAKWFDLAELFMLGHFLAGMVNMLKIVVSIYLAECAPNSARGWCSMVVSAGGNLFVLFLWPLFLPSLFGTDRLWFLVPGLCLCLSLVHLFGASQFPESPKHLFIAQNDKIRAQSAISFYHGPAANIAQLFEEYTQESRLLRERTVEWSEFWTNRRLRWPATIALMAASVPAFSLLVLKSQYQQSMLISYGLDQSGAIISDMILALITAPLSFAAPFLIDRFKRRPYILSVIALSATELLLVACAQSLLGINDRGGMVVVALALIGFGIGQASSHLGILQITPILIGELFPHQARAKATQLVYLLPMVLMLCVVLLYPLLIIPLGPLFFVLLALFTLSIFAFLFRWLPETKDLPVDRIFRRFTLNQSESEYGTIQRTINDH